MSIIRTPSPHRQSNRSIKPTRPNNGSLPQGNEPKAGAFKFDGPPGPGPGQQFNGPPGPNQETIRQLQKQGMPPTGRWAGPESDLF